MKWIVASLMLLAAQPAEAQVKVAVGKVSGSISFMIESSLKTTLKKQGSIELVSATDIAAAKAKHGEDIAAWAPEVGAAAVVEADAVRQGPGWLTTIRVVSGSSGKVLKTWKVKGKEIKKVTGAIESSLWRELGPAISKAKPPKKGAGSGATPAPVAEEEPEEKEPAPIATSKPEPKTAPAATTTAQPAAAPSEASSSAVVEPEPARSGPRARNQVPLEVIAGVDFFARSFRYNDDLFGQLRPYTLSGAPSAMGRLTWYPGAHFATGIAAAIGLQLGLEYAFGVESSDASGASYPTSAMELDASLLGRIPLGSKHEVTLAGGGGMHRFVVSKGDGAAEPDFPEVSYGFLRFGLGARFQVIEDLSLRIGAGYRLVTSAGGIQTDDWFPRSGAGGLDGTFAIGYSVIDSLELVLGVSGRHYFYTMNPEPGDPRIAGGAVDQYFGGTLAVSWTLR